MSTLFVLGGARSGKSRFGVTSQPSDLRVTFVATAEARDADMAARIARHRAERPRHWKTVEAPYDLVPAVQAAARDANVVVIDCLTVWVANRLLRGDADTAILDDTDTLAKLLESQRMNATVVSNEVGEGVHPPTADGMRFRDTLGLVNQRIAAACDTVVLMVAGVPLTVKSRPLAHDAGFQAP